MLKLRFNWYINCAKFNLKFNYLRSDSCTDTVISDSFAYVLLHEIIHNANCLTSVYTGCVLRDFYNFEKPFNFYPADFKITSYKTV